MNTIYDVVLELKNLVNNITYIKLNICEKNSIDYICQDARLVALDSI